MCLMKQVNKGLTHTFRGDSRLLRENMEECLGTKKRKIDTQEVENLEGPGPSAILSPEVFSPRTLHS